MTITNVQDVSIAVQLIAKNFPGVRLTGLEVSREAYESIKESGRIMLSHVMTCDPDADKKYPTILVVEGVTITKAKPFISPAMLVAGKKVVQAFGLKTYAFDPESAAAQVYEAMIDAKECRG